MGRLRTLGTATALALAPLAISTPSAAQADDAPSREQQVVLEDLRTNMRLLSALVERRTEIERAAGDNKSDALAFLDRRIDQVRNDVLRLRERLKG